MISKKVKDQIKVEQKLIKDFVDTFKLEQENEDLKQEVMYLKTLLENDSQSTAIRRSTITRKNR